jgi:hypothetical protein
MDDSLSSESFYQGAKKAAHRAMDDHGRPEYDEFALHAGVAVEKLAKAVLAAKNPVYVAEIRSNSADMVMYLGGHVQLDEEKVRTVGATEAIKRLQKIGVLQKDSKLDLLIEMRNGAAHSTPDSTLAKGMITPLARTVETLVNDLGRPLDEFWGRWTDAVKNAVNEQEDQVFRDVQLRITQARHAFEDRFKNLPPGSKELVLIGARPKSSASIDVMGVDEGGTLILNATGGDCPACGGPSTLTFEPTEVTSTNTHYWVNAFTCSVCTFKVVGPDEMAALRKANAPLVMDGLVFHHGPTLAPEELPVIGETKPG